MAKYSKWLIRLLGPLLLIVFLAVSDLREMGRILSTAAPWPVLLSLLLMPLFIVVKAWRWVLILRQLGLRLALYPASMLYTIGIYLGTITPGQAGDLVKAWYLRDQGQPLGAALVSVVLDRLFDLLIMGMLATLGAVAFAEFLPNQTAQSVVAGLFVVVVLLVMTLLVARGPRDWLLGRVLPPLLPKRLRAMLEELQAQLSQLALRGRALTTIGLVSLLSPLVTLYRVYLLFIAININIPLLAIVAMTALVALVQVLPSIAGIGTRDALLIGLLAIYGYPPETALSLSALLLLINIEHIVVGLLVSLRYPLGRVSLATDAAQPPTARSEL
jgi:glycosyltransferase 2 family protein